MMILTKEDSGLLPSPGKWDLPFDWSIFELSPRKNGRGQPDLIAVGSLERRTDRGLTIDVRVVDLMETQPTIRPVMVGEGAPTSRNRVKLTPGDVLIHRESMRGRGVGILVFNIVTAWAQRVHPDRHVEPITLVRAKCASEAEWQHEYRKLTEFYGRFGFKWQTPPIENGYNHFPSDPLLVRDLTQVPEADLPQIRRIDLPAATTAMFERLHESADERERLQILSAALVDHRTKWRSIGSRLNYFAWIVAFGFGVAAARLLAWFT